MDSFRIAEERIKKTLEEGVFDNLPGAGKPLPKDEFEHLPPELRMSVRMMKNAGFTPEDANLRQDIRNLERLINDCIDPEQKQELKRQLNEKMLRYNQMLSKKRIDTNSGIFKNYEQKIEKKLFGK
ncbi:DUF1992 domain-containing protein [Domibacillus sp. A3M-37]|uniref:DnaJ family domain-containing protein n=1 Tax=Domibacillus sp. A3M-37 TaxID=2962037 RepID=UPI0020B638B1|nr:DUF1992 domain-containing protein [Domibacillus sp. A3M-37]MCP3762780.1 DUF1992 domain-containing protein [Domibacillus sp. A3M-37]